MVVRAAQTSLYVELEECASTLHLWFDVFNSASKRERREVPEAAVQRSAVLQELLAGASTTECCNLPISSTDFSMWCFFDSSNSEQWSAADLCTLLKSSSFLQDDAGVESTCSLLTGRIRVSFLNVLRSVPDDSLFVWRPHLPWHKAQAITEELCTLPANELQATLSRFHINEMYGAPRPLLRAWLAHRAGSGRLDLSELKFTASSSDIWSFKQHLYNIWAAMGVLGVTEVLMPRGFHMQCMLVPDAHSHTRESRDHASLIAEDCCQMGYLPVLNRVTSVDFSQSFASPQYLCSMLETFPNVRKLRVRDSYLSSSVLASYKFLSTGCQMTSEDRHRLWRHLPAMLADLPSLQSLTILHGGNDDGYITNPDGLMHALLHAAEFCSSLTAVHGLDECHMQFNEEQGDAAKRMAALRRLQAMHTHLCALQWLVYACPGSGRVDVNHPWRPQDLAAFTAATSLSMKVASYPETDAPPALDGFLNSLAEVLEPLKRLRRLQMYISGRKIPWQTEDMTHDGVEPFQSLLNRLDIFYIDDFTLQHLLPFCSFTCLKVMHLKGRRNKRWQDGESLLSLTALTKLRLDFRGSKHAHPVASSILKHGMYTAIACLSHLRTLEMKNTVDFEASMLPHVLQLPRLERLVVQSPGLLTYPDFDFPSAEPGAAPAFTSLTKLCLGAMSAGVRLDEALRWDYMRFSEKVAKLLKQMTALKHLELGTIMYDVCHLFDALSKLRHLRFLSVHCDCDITPANVQPLCMHLKQMTILEGLELRANVGSSACALQIARALSGLGKLGMQKLSLKFRLGKTASWLAEKHIITAVVRDMKMALAGTFCSVWSLLPMDIDVFLKETSGGVDELDCEESDSSEEMADG